VLQILSTTDKSQLRNTSGKLAACLQNGSHQILKLVWRIPSKPRGANSDQKLQ
jgi:hypothetical protein